jgi:ATP-binding cassette subfamily B multidrug efflux pump
MVLFCFRKSEKLKRFQMQLRGTESPGPGAPPPAGLLAFYWHFVRQTKGWYAAMFTVSLVVAALDTVIPLFIGKLVSLMEATDRMAALEAQWPLLGGSAVPRDGGFHA